MSTRGQQSRRAVRKRADSRAERHTATAEIEEGLFGDSEAEVYEAWVSAEEAQRTKVAEVVRLPVAHQAAIEPTAPVAATARRAAMN